MAREAIVCDGDASRVRIRRGALCLDYDLATGRYTIAHGEACVLEACEASFTPGRRAVSTAASAPHRWRIGEVSDALGQARCLAIGPAETSGAVRWSLLFCLYRTLDAITVRLAVENGSGKEIELRELRPLVTSEAGGFRFGHALKTTRPLPNAWAGASGSVGVRHAGRGFSCESPISFVVVDPSAQMAVAAGALDPAKSFVRFRLKLTSAAPPAYRLEAIQATPVGCSRNSGVTVPPGAHFAPERIILVFAGDGHTAFEHYADCAGTVAGCAGTVAGCAGTVAGCAGKMAGATAKPGKEKRPHVPCGWSSWPAYHDAFTEQDVLHNVELLEKELKPFGLDTVLVGAGWQHRGHRSGGPWRAGAHFPHGMAWLAQQIRKRGLHAGLWIRPLEVDGLRLDPSSEFTHTTLRNEVRRLTGSSGFDSLTIDCLHDDAFERNDSFLPDESAITALEALRRTVGALREALGNGRHLAAGNLTLGAGLGVVDSNRTGHNAAGDNWRLVKEHTVKGLAARYALHGRCWINDPGPVQVRAPLTLGQARAWASLCALAGGMVMASGRMAALPAERLEVLKRVMPAYGACARPMDLFEQKYPEVWDLPVEAGGARWNIIGLFNWETTPREIKRTRARTVEINMQRLRANDTIEGRRRRRTTLERIAAANPLIREENERLRQLLAGQTLGEPLLELHRKAQASSRFKNITITFDELGLEPAEHHLVYDFWDDRFLGLHSGRLKVLVRLADCAVLAVHPALGVPQLISTNRHVTQGGVEIERLAWDDARSELAGASRLVENDAYVATVYVPREFEFVRAEAGIGTVHARHDTPETVRLTLHSLTSKSVRWKLKFNRIGAKRTAARRPRKARRSRA